MSGSAPPIFATKIASPASCSRSCRRRLERTVAYRMRCETAIPRTHVSSMPALSMKSSSVALPTTPICIRSTIRIRRSRFGYRSACSQPPGSREGQEPQNRRPYRVPALASVSNKPTKNPWALSARSGCKGSFSVRQPRAARRSNARRTSALAHVHLPSAAEMPHPMHLALGFAQKPFFDRIGQVAWTQRDRRGL